MTTSLKPSVTQTGLDGGYAVGGGDASGFQPAAIKLTQQGWPADLTEDGPGLTPVPAWVERKFAAPKFS